MNNNFATAYDLLLKPRTKIMGILNATPDSFSGDGIIKEPKEIISASMMIVEKFINEGADIIDIGGESTRPGATPVNLDMELQRVIPVITAIRQHFSIPISIDTTKSTVARQAISAGATVINDVSGLMLDPEMIAIVVKSRVPVVIMHSKISNTSIDVVDCVAHDLEEIILKAISQGIKPSQIIIDPGIGFGKTPLQNLQLIRNLNQFKSMPYPLLLGASRKSFIGYLTGADVESRLPGSLAAVTIGVLAKTDIIRVHDVAATKQIIQLLESY